MTTSALAATAAASTTAGTAGTAAAALPLLSTLLPWVAVGFGVAMALCLLRLLRGPGLPDRILALDTLYVNALALLVTLGLWQGTPLYFELALLIGLLGFVGTVVLSRHALARGRGGRP